MRWESVPAPASATLCTSSPSHGTSSLNLARIFIKKGTYKWISPKQIKNEGDDAEEFVMEFIGTLSKELGEQIYLIAGVEYRFFSHFRQF